MRRRHPNYWGKWFPKPWVGGSNPSGPTIPLHLISDGRTELRLYPESSELLDCSEIVVNPCALQPSSARLTTLGKRGHMEGPSQRSSMLSDCGMFVLTAATLLVRRWMS